MKIIEFSFHILLEWFRAVRLAVSERFVWATVCLVFLALPAQSAEGPSSVTLSLSGVKVEGSTSIVWLGPRPPTFSTKIELMVKNNEARSRTLSLFSIDSQIEGHWNENDGNTVVSLVPQGEQPLFLTLNVASRVTPLIVVISEDGVPVHILHILYLPYSEKTDREVKTPELASAVGKDWKGYTIRSGPAPSGYSLLSYDFKAEGNDRECPSKWMKCPPASIGADGEVVQTFEVQGREATNLDGHQYVNVVAILVTHYTVKLVEPQIFSLSGFSALKW